MAIGVEHQPGGILGLCRLLSEHGEAIEYDLITLGLRIESLGTPRLSWRDLWVIVRQAPRTSALARSIHGSRAAWSQDTYILADLFDAIQGGNWQRGGGKGSRPKPFPRPKRDDDKTTTRYGSGALTIDEFDAWLKAREVEV